MQSPPKRTERRCKARNKRGDPCAATVVGAGGYCVVHDPERKTDMKALGRRGGKANGRPNPERVHEGLRAFLQREVPPERVWQALEAAMLGSNEAARVSASKVLIDALSEGQAGGCPRCKEAAAEAEANSEKHREALIKLVLDSVAQIIEADPHPVGLASMAAAYLDERQKQRIAKLRTLRLDQIRSASVDELTREALAGA
jgi:hypothetical protein